MKVELITIGTELITGIVQDSNAAFLAKQLSELGFQVIFIQSVGDNQEDIISALKAAESRADIIITTGGLGPTQDDLTKEVVAKFLNVGLEYNPDLEQDLLKFYGDKLTEQHKSQACIPAGAVYLKTNWGSAPGFFYRSAGKSLIALPGVPYELERIYEVIVKDLLIKEYGLKARIDRLRFRTFGLFETEVEERIVEVIKKFQLYYGILAGSYGVDIFIDRTKTTETDQKISVEMAEIFGDYLYASGSKSISEVIGELLKQAGEKMATAESCTGGLISSMITQVPGSSDYFLGSIVAYDNRVKTELLKVGEEVLKDFGAVSAEIATRMAFNIKKATSADWGISTTGIAGPSGETETKPVGLVYVGLCGPDGIEIVKELRFSGDRQVIQQRTSFNALNQLRLSLLERSRS